MRRSNYHYHNHNVRIKEHRAPTDESVKLLYQLEQEAKNKFLNKFDFTHNILGIESSVLFFEDFGYIKYEIVCILNSKRFVVRGKISKYDYSDIINSITKWNMPTENLISWFSSQLANEISNQLLEDGFFKITNKK